MLAYIPAPWIRHGLLCPLSYHSVIVDIISTNIKSYHIIVMAYGLSIEFFVFFFFFPKTIAPFFSERRGAQHLHVLGKVQEFITVLVQILPSVMKNAGEKQDQNNIEGIGQVQIIRCSSYSNSKKTGILDSYSSYSSYSSYVYIPITVHGNSLVHTCGKHFAAPKMSCWILPGSPGT